MSRFNYDSITRELTLIAGNNGYNLIAPFEFSPSTKTHYVGDFIIYHNMICEVTTAITVGDTIIVYPSIGYNVKPTTSVQEQITEINSLLNRLFNEKENKPTIKIQILNTGSTSVTFKGLPTTEDHIINFYTSTGIGYTSISVSASEDEVALAFDPQPGPVTVICEIREG